MKIDVQRFLDAINYIALINAVPLDDLDFSDFPKQNVSKKDRNEFKFTGLNNKDFILMHLMGDKNE